MSENVYNHGQRQLDRRIADQETFILNEQQIAFSSKDFSTSPAADQVRAHTSYSGCDIKAVVSFYDANAKDKDQRVKFKVLGDLQTMTYSTHREKFPVRTLGRTTAKGYTRGPRTIGGTLIFTVFDKEVLSDLLVQNYQTDSAKADNYGFLKAVLVDQIPPFDISVTFVNEYGSVSRMVIYGVELVNEGQTMSIDDLITENVCSFVARHVEPMYSMRNPNADPRSTWEDAIQGELDFEGMTKDVRVRRLLNTMEKPQPSAKKIYSEEYFKED